MVVGGRLEASVLAYPNKKTRIVVFRDHNAVTVCGQEYLTSYSSPFNFLVVAVGSRSSDLLQARKRIFFSTIVHLLECRFLFFHICIYMWSEISLETFTVFLEQSYFPTTWLMF